MGLMLDALKRIDGRLPAECPQEPPATCDDNRALSDGTGQPFESWWDASCGEDHPLLGALDAMPDLPAPELQSAGQAPPPNAPGSRSSSGASRAPGTCPAANSPGVRTSSRRAGAPALSRRCSSRGPIAVSSCEKRSFML